MSLHDALPISAQTAQSVRGSEETVRNAVDDIHALVEAVSVIEGQLTGLQEALAQVAQVAQGIDAIAKQTNLLADRKSTRLNSSLMRISYAVFCLQKKTHQTYQTT